jgi:anaerobic magnesium-protoporphyrin IX monomethyl ester cyclase
VRQPTGVLLVDLNNFARYPTPPIGYLASVLRQASFDVSVFAPLMVGVEGTTREARPGRFGLAAARLNHLAATSRLAWLRHARDRLGRRRLSDITAHERAVLDGFRAALQSSRPQAVLVSTYLMHRALCATLCRICQEAGIRVLIGGPYFVQPEVIAEWVAMPGLTALAAGEVELELPSIVDTMLAGGDLGRHDGIFVADAQGRPRGRIAQPLLALDRVPFPDYSDFPWQAYPNRIVPVITGRGCGWGVCSFCSDVTSSAGRSYRSRSPGNVIDEIAAQHQSLQATRFAFTDLKLNSDLAVWRGIAQRIQSVAPGAQWIGAVHVGREADNGLSETELREAARSGCVRLTTGLESGSQRVLDRMKKGNRVEGVSAFLHAASAAGISTRCTMIIGYPGETADDVDTSTEFLARHTRQIERVSLNRLQVMTGTTLHRALKRAPARFKGFGIVQEDAAAAQVEHRDDTIQSAPHRKAVMRMLAEVHRINSRDLLPRAREFEGVM